MDDESPGAHGGIRVIEASARTPLPPLPRPVLFALLTLAYFAAGKLGLAVAFVHANATAVWPATGIALAATLLFGYRVWPAILAGAFLVNVTTEVSIPTALGIAIGNTLEAIVGGWFVNRFAGGMAVFQHPRNIFRFAILAALVSTTVSPSIGVLSLWSGGFAETPRLSAIWLTWWLGDAVGALLFTPLILLWARPLGRRLPARSWFETAALAIAVAATGWIVWGHTVPIAFLCLPVLVWAAFRFGRRGAMAVAFVISAIALWGALRGYGPFIMPTPHESLLFLQAFVGVITLTVLALAAEVRERERVEGDVRRAHDELEQTVQERTALLQEAVRDLEKSRSVLNEAQRVASIGSWEWDAVHDRVTWSDELYRIYGLDTWVPIDFEGFLARVHPDDRERVVAVVTSSFESGQAFEFQHRVVRPDGEVRTLLGRGQVIQEDGRTVRMMGTGQDITERAAAEEALRESEERFRLLAEQASVTISFSDDSGTTYVSPAVRSLLGYDPGELIGERGMDLVHPEDRERIEAQRSRLAGEAGPIVETFRTRHRDGTYVWVESIARALRSPAGELQGTVTVTRDVTDRVEGERFRDLLHRVTAAANQAPSANDALQAALAEICRFKQWALGHVYVPAQDGSGDLAPTGIWYPQEPVGHEEFRRITEATWLASGRGLPGRVLASGKPAWIPDVTKDPDFSRARQVWGLGLAAAFGFPVQVGDEILAVLEFFTTAVQPPEPRFLDVLSEIGVQLGQVLRRQQIEEALRRRETQLAQAQAIAHLGSWEWDLIRDRVDWSDELFRIHGREPRSIVVDYEEFLAHVHPKDRARVDRAVRSALDNADEFTYEYTIVRPDGTERILLTQGRVKRDSQGRVLRMYGTCQDITERKAAEDALRASELRYRFITDYSTDLITVLTPDGRCTYASPAARAVLGYTGEELIGRSAIDLVHPEDQEAVDGARRALFKSFMSQSVVCRLRRKTGGWIWAETTSRGVRSPNTGLVESIVSVTRNVTERRQAAETIRLLQQVTAIANEAASVESAMKSALEVVCRHTGWYFGHVYMPSRSAEGVLTPTDIWHVETPERFEQFRLLTQATPQGLEEGILGRVLSGGKGVWIRDLRSEPGFARKAAAEALGLRSALAFPVTGDGETLGVLEFFSSESQPMEPRLMELMENIGAQLGQVVMRRRTEDALLTSEVHFRAVAETAGDGIITIDDESRIVYCNPSAARIFGYDDLVGKPLVMIIPERYRDAHHAGMDRFLRTGRSRILGRTVEIVGLHRDGHEVPIEYSSSDWRTDRGVFFTGIVRDITPRKRAEEVLSDKMQELSRSNAELALFSYVVSHDLREPLRTVASNVQLVARRLGPVLDPAVGKSIDFAMSGVRHMRKLIEDLLAYSRVGTEGQQFQELDVDDVLDEVIEILRATIEAEGAVVTREDLPTILADRTQIAQVFQNLLANALKFHNTEPPRVHVSARRDDHDWVFSVKDEGIGFAPEYAEHVFTIFQRLHTSMEYPGTGLGLAICRKIVERHGGRIWAESEPDKGSVFHFTIPARD